MPVSTDSTDFTMMSWSLGRMIGVGGYGEVYMIYNSETKEVAAMKSVQNYPRLLRREADILKDLAGGIGIPRLIGEGSGYLVLELLGLCLERLLLRCGGRFTVKTTVMIAQQAIKRIRLMHSKGYLHCDIKPGNFLVDNDKSTNVIYIVDFGVSRRHNRYGAHEQVSKFIGTPMFSSIKGNFGENRSWSDDLESLGYMLIYLMQGTLPWADIVDRDTEKANKKIGDVKRAFPIEALCQQVPDEFATYFRYVNGLRFGESPDYGYLRNLFEQLFDRLGLENDGYFDWDEDSSEASGEGDV